MKKTEPSSAGALLPILAQHFPDSVPDMYDTLRALAPYAELAREDYRRAKLLEAAAALPLARVEKAVTEALEPVKKVLDGKAAAAAELAARRARDAKETADAESPEQVPGVDLGLTRLVAWLKGSGALEKKVAGLVAALREAAAVVGSLSRWQAGSRFSANAIGTCYAAMGYLDGLSGDERAVAVVEIAERALAEIRQFRAGEIPEPKRPSSVTGKGSVKSILGLSWYSED